MDEFDLADVRWLPSCGTVHAAALWAAADPTIAFARRAVAARAGAPVPERYLISAAGAPVDRAAAEAWAARQAAADARVMFNVRSDRAHAVIVDLGPAPSGGRGTPGR